MTTFAIPAPLAHHDAAAQRLLDRIEQLTADTANGEIPSRHRRALRAARSELAAHLADAQLLADAVGIDTLSREWMRRALTSASDEALRALVPQIRHALTRSDAEHAARAIGQ